MLLVKFSKILPGKIVKFSLGRSAEIRQFSCEICEFRGEKVCFGVHYNRNNSAVNMTKRTKRVSRIGYDNDY